MKSFQSDPRAVQLRDLLEQSVHDGTANKGASSGDEIDRLLANAKVVTAELTELRMYAARATERLEELMQVIAALVTFDYSRKASIGDKDGVFDGIASGLNMLGEELSLTTVSKTYLNNIIESMTDLLIVLDQEGLIESLNQAAYDLSLYSRNEVVGQAVTLLFEDVAGLDVVRRGGVKDHEMTCRTKGGRRIPISFSASIMRDDHGRVQGVVCVARDLTESKRIEEERLLLRDAARRQAILVEELSTPIIPIADDILVLPLIGSVDEQRSARITQALLDDIASTRARVAIMDVTGVRAISAESVHGMLRAVRAAGMVGAQAVLTGIRPAMARALVELGESLSGVMTFGTLQRGIAYAMRHMKADRERKPRNVPHLPISR